MQFEDVELREALRALGVDYGQYKAEFLRYLRPVVADQLAESRRIEQRRDGSIRFADRAAFDAEMHAAMVSGSLAAVFALRSLRRQGPPV